MSYVDRNSSGNQKAFTGGAVALIQAGIALALINGFTVNVLKSDPPHRTDAINVPLDPLPPPPSAEPKQQDKLVERQIATPVPRIRIETAIPNNTPAAVNTDTTLGNPTGDMAGDTTDFSTLAPPETSPRFQPRGAIPRNNAATWVTTQDYPSAELRAEHQGIVRFRLDIDSAGRVSSCVVVNSSGFSGLDEATCKVVSKRARFQPATDANGAISTGSYSGAVRWVVPRD